MSMMNPSILSCSSCDDIIESSDLDGVGKLEKLLTEIGTFGRYIEAQKKRK